MAGIVPAGADQRSRNELRPLKFDDIVGQDRAKRMMKRAIASAFARTRPLEHTLLVAASGLGKSTFSHVIAHELGVNIYELEAPVSLDTLLELREVMRPGEVLKIEEIHQQGVMERRGRGTATQPEVLYSVMEDRVITTERGLLDFPAITVMGTTTDEGMLPDAFVNRFTLRPQLVPYTLDELTMIVMRNARALHLRLTHEAVAVFAGAARGTPRQVNNFVRNAVIHTPPGELCDSATARAVLEDNGITLDGLTSDMQKMLTFLFTHARQQNADGEVKHQASVNTIATAIGKSRDSKAVALRVEPYLIELGLIQVGHGGRKLTDAGIERAKELIGTTNGGTP